MKLMDVEYLRITTSRQCCTNTCNLTFGSLPKKNPSQKVHPTGHGCFTIQLFCARGEAPTLQATFVKTTVSTSAFATSRCCWRCCYWYYRGAGLRVTRGTKSGHAKCRSLRVANPNSTSASEKPWRHEDDGWYTHRKKKLTPQMCVAETHDGWGLGSISRSWELKGKSDGKMSTWYCSITTIYKTASFPMSFTSYKLDRTRKVIRVSWQFFVTFLGWLSDLQPGDEKVTLNHLDDNDSECLFLFDGLLFIQQIVLGWTATRANVVFIIQKCLYFSLHLKRWKDFGQISLNEFKRTKQVAILLLILPVAYDCQEVCILRPIVWVDLVPLLPPKR